MNPTTPDRRPVDSTTPAPTPGPQPYGTWFSRWHHLYTATPTPVDAPSLEPTPTLPKRGNLTVAA